MSAPTLTLLRDFGDWFSPIVVKELRQGLRTRFFTTATILFHTFIILLLASVMLGAPVVAVNGIFWGAAGVMLLVVLPLRAFNALNSESSDGTLDMLTLTSIDSMRILSGKWLALVSQSLLVAGSLLPYMVARYYFGGVEILREALALVMLLLGSGIATAALLAFSSQPSMVLRLTMLAGIACAAAPLGVFTSFLVTSANSDFMLREFFGMAAWQQWGLVVGVLALAAYVMWYFLALGASRIAPPSENHSTRKRVIVLGVHAALMIIGLLLCYLGKDAEDAMVALMPLLGLTMITCMDVLTEDMPRFPIAVAELAGRGRQGRLAGRLLHPGWASGIFFSSLLCVMAMALITAITARERSWDWDDGPAMYVLCVLCAAFIPTTIRLNRRNLFANWWAVQVCMMALGILLAIFCEATNTRAFGNLGVVTPVTTLFGAAAAAGHSGEDAVMLMGSFFSLVWVVGTMLHARVNFAQYAALEEEALGLEPRTSTLTSTPATNSP